MIKKIIKNIPTIIISVVAFFLLFTNSVFAVTGISDGEAVSGIGNDTTSTERPTENTAEGYFIVNVKGNALPDSMVIHYKNIKTGSKKKITYDKVSSEKITYGPIPVGNYKVTKIDGLSKKSFYKNKTFKVEKDSINTYNLNISQKTTTLVKNNLLDFLRNNAISLILLVGITIALLVYKLNDGTE